MLYKKLIFLLPAILFVQIVNVEAINLKNYLNKQILSLPETLTVKNAPNPKVLIDIITKTTDLLWYIKSLRQKTNNANLFAREYQTLKTRLEAYEQYSEEFFYNPDEITTCEYLDILLNSAIENNFTYAFDNIISRYSQEELGDLSLSLLLESARESNADKIISKILKLKSKLKS